MTLLGPDHPLLASADERATYFNLAATRLGYAPAVIEKDFWVCVALAAMSTASGELRWVFKGGTSLSKVHGVIHRFSEDIDLTLSREGFPTDLDPHASGVGSNERRRRLARLETWAHERLRDVVVPALRETLGAWLGAQDWSLDVADFEDPEQWLFRYPGGGDDAYMPGHVKLEFGCRGALEPRGVQTIRTLVAAGTGDPSVDVVVDVPVLALERTFYEKATAVHAFWHQGNPAEGGKPKPLRPRMSRHWYDLHQMWSHPEHRASILENLALLDEVVTHKETWHASKAARYDEARTGPKLVPDGGIAEAAAHDYAAMESMFPASPERPAWDVIVASCGEIEAELRRQLATRASW